MQRISIHGIGTTHCNYRHQWTRTVNAIRSSNAEPAHHGLRRQPEGLPSWYGAGVASIMVVATEGYRASMVGCGKAALLAQTARIAIQVSRFYISDKVYVAVIDERPAPLRSWSALVLRLRGLFTSCATKVCSGSTSLALLVPLRVLVFAEG